MDHAPLRPLPGRPRGPVPDAEAVRAVAAAAPALDAVEREALALVALVGRPRHEAGARLGLDAEALAVTLTRARKGLRRTLSPLPGSGWCERAERLISDRMDGALAAAAAPRLDVHLRNCPRCVEHERRLVGASDALVTGLRPEEEAAAEAPALEAVPDPGEADFGEAALAAQAPAQAAPADPAPAPEPAAPPRSRRQLAAAVSWHTLLALAVLLALASLALAVAGALGAQI